MTAIAMDLPEDVIDGTNEILNRTIAQRLIKGNTDL